MNGPITLLRCYNFEQAKETLALLERAGVDVGLVRVERTPVMANPDPIPAYDILVAPQDAESALQVIAPEGAA